MRNILMLLPLMLFLTSVQAAETQSLWTTGKINIVLSIVLTILVLIFIFLFVLERKVSRLEKKISE